MGDVISKAEALRRFTIYASDIIEILEECKNEKRVSSGVYDDYKPGKKPDDKATAEKKLPPAELKALKKSQRIEAANRLTQSYRLEWKKGAPTPRRVEYDGLTSRRFNGLRLKPNDVSSFYMGIFPRRVGDRKVKVESTNLWSTIFVSRNPAICDAYNIKPNNSRIVNSSTKTATPTLQRFMDTAPMDGKVVPTLPEVLEYFEECWELYNEIGGRDSTIPTRREHASVKFRGESNPGYRYSEILGLSCKNDAAMFSWQVHTNQMRRMQRKAQAGATIDLSGIIRGFWSIGGRRSMEDADEGELVKSRPIHMPEMHSQFISGGIESAISNIID